MPRKKITPELEEPVTEVVNRNRNKTNNLMAYQKDFGAKPGEISSYIRFALASWDLPPIDISDPEQVKERIRMYFQHCADNDRKPQIVGLCNWLGITRQTLGKWQRGDIKSRESTHTEIIRKATNFIEEMWADFMFNGKINPAAGIFIAKNWYGYKDIADVVITPNNPLQDLDDEQVAERILQNKPLKKRIEDALPLNDTDDTES